MGRKNLNTIFVVALLVMAMFPANAIALPDVPPTCSLRSNTDHADTSAMLTAVSVDTLGDAGVDNIELLEDDSHMSTRDCYDTATCVYTRSVVKTTGGWHNYQAVCTDSGGQETLSSVVSVHFDGTNMPPVITDASPSSPYTMDETESVRFEVTAHDPEGDDLSYEWRVDGTDVYGPGTRDYYYFSEDVSGTETFTLSVYVRDDAGAVAVHAWTVHVTDVEGEVSVRVVDDGLTECHWYRFVATVDDAHDPIDHLEWNFGDGTTATSTAQWIDHEFRDVDADGDNFTVTVVAVEDDGDRLSGSVTAHVYDVDPRSVVATCETPTINEGERAFFSGHAAVNCNADLITHYTWESGDGRGDGGPDLLSSDVVYRDDGVYNVTFTAYDEDSSTSDTCIQTVLDLEPEASFDYDPLDPREGVRVEFRDTSSSYDDIVSWNWDFDDGDTSTDQHPNHIFTVEGDYEVCLTVTDEDGDTDRACATISVGNDAPVIDLIATPTSGDEPLEVEFECVATGGNAPLDFLIDFGDGSVPMDSDLVTHTYEADGDYTATCTVTDADGDVGSDDELIEVHNSVPELELVATPDSGDEALDVHFDCIWVGGNEPADYEITFDEFEPFVPGDTLDHTYTEDGIYLAVCEGTDADGDTGRAEANVTVLDNAPTVELVATPDFGDDPLDVHFDCLVTGGNAPFDYYIDSGDFADSATDTLDHTYADPGVYAAFCEVTDADGDVASDTTNITVDDNAPIVDLIVSPDTGDEALEVEVTCDVTDGTAPFDYFIDFGDGTSTTSDHEFHTFDVAGSYVVTCTVTDASLDVGSDTESVTVLNNAPDAVLVLNTTSGDEALDVEANCTGIGGNAPFTYEIDWGDGTAPDTDSLATHTYDTDGRYTVTCTVVDFDGDGDTASEDVLVFDAEPTVDFTWDPITPDELEDVMFDATIVSHDPITRLWWDFDDGDRAFVEDPTYAFPASGDYDVTIFVEDSDGSVASATHTVHVSENPPTASIVVDPLSGDEPLTVEVTCSAADGDAPLTFTLDMGDGSPLLITDRVTYTFDQNGSYDVTCSVTDADADVDTATETVDVFDTEPYVFFDWTPDTPDEMESVLFDGRASDAYDGITDIYWDFGDGEFDDSDDLTPVHEFRDAGTYTVTLTITDGDGSVVSYSDDIDVAINAADVTLLADPSSGDEPLEVDFVCAASEGNPPYTYELDFGDGSPTEATNVATHTYDQDGIYTSVCTVTDDDGDVSSDSVDVEVFDTAPSVSFTYVPAAPDELEDVFFDGTISGYDEPITWVWDFDDGTTSVEEDPVHAFDAGTYNVSLTAVDDDGSVSVAWELISVADDAPVPTLWADPMTGPEGLEVDFECTVAGGTEPFTYEIDFGDGSPTSSDALTSHVYPTPGRFEATCTVTDFDGDFATSAPAVIIVDDNAPVVDLVVDPVAGREGDTFDFDCLITGGDDPMAVTIDFGDGSAPVAGSSATHTYTDEGSYIAYCEVFDFDADYGYDEEVVDIANNVPVVDVTVDVPAAFEPHSINYECVVGDGNEPFTFDIDFGDGSPHGVDPTGTHDYSVPGSYPLRCTVTDVDGDIGWDEIGIHVWDNPPIVDLTAVPTVGPEGVTVSFDCDWTGGNPDFDMVLDFDDGSSETYFGPDSAFSTSHVYPLEGDYNATCRVVDLDLDVGDDWEVITVIDNPPVVDLNVTPDTGLEPLTVDYNCSIGGGNEPFDVLVDFDDGTTSTDLTGTHDFPLPGNYTVTCTVTDADLDVDSDSVDVEVLNNPPVVDLVPSHTGGPEGMDIFFDCLVAGGNAPFDYVLDFGDGSPVEFTDSAWHTYPLEGLYDAVCTVTDDDGDVGFDLETINISNAGPVVNVEVNESIGFEPLTVEYTCEAAGGNEPYSYEIDFDDGTPHEFTDTGVHTYPVPGVYDLTCIVTDTDGDVGSDHTGVHVIDNPPVVDLSADWVGTLWEGVVVDFACDVTDGNPDFDYVLDFDDGTFATFSGSDRVFETTHTYTLEGEYNATCTVTDDDLDTGSDWYFLNVTNNVPVVNLWVNETTGLEPHSIEYDCTVGDGNEPFTYDIDFGDGSPHSASPSGTYDYAVPGDYVMVCTVIDTDGDVGSDSDDIHVIDNPPVVDLTASWVGPLWEGVVVDFTCDITDGNPDYTVLLTYDDGGSWSTITGDTSVTVSHTYSLEGDFNATCTVTDDDGDVGLDSELLSVANNPPVPDLNLNVTSGFEPLSVFYNCTVGDGNEPFVFDIDFGDGRPHSSSPTGTVDYAVPGAYDMTCTVTDTDGDVEADAEHVDVIDNPPVVSLDANPTFGPEGVEVDFDCDWTGGNPDFDMMLDFGDGTFETYFGPDSAYSTSHVYPLEGVYNATCGVTDDDLDFDLDWEEINVTNNVPVVHMWVNETSGLEPHSVEYDCTVGGGNEPYTIDVDFGDGSVHSASATGTYTYTTPGFYDLTCTATDVDGDVGSDYERIEVLNDAPIVDLSASWVGPLWEGVEVDFTCDIAGGNPDYTVLLEYGDGSSWSTITSDSSVSATFTYTLEGDFNATCTVTDNDGDVGVDSDLLAVANNPPVTNLYTNISVVDISEGVEALDVLFNCTAGDGNEPFVYTIDFGDGNLPVAIDTITHTYIQNGTYAATCEVVDVDGDSDIDVESVIVHDSEPDANFTYAPADPIEGDTVSFTDTSTAYDSVVAWDWDLGDGNTSAVADPTHTYGLEGSYLVTLCVTDGDGSVTCHSELVDVGNNVPTVTVTAVPASGDEPLDSTVTCSATGGNAPLDYLILYGDGDSTTSTVSAHTYDQDGTYGVVCQVTDVDGDVGTGLDTVDVADTEPTASFTFAPVDPEVDEDVNFTDTSTPGHDAIVSWNWDFDDGTTSTDQDPTHAFIASGTYIVNLTVTDADGSTDWSAQDVFVDVAVGPPAFLPPPLAIGVTNESANITWGTTQAADSLIQYGLAPDALSSWITSVALETDHNLALLGLTANTTYYYNVTSCNALAMCTMDGVHSFTTLASAVGPDVTSPTVTLTAPGDGTTDGDGNVTVMYSVTDDMAAGLTCDVYSDTSGVWSVDDSQAVLNPGSGSWDYTSLADGTYTWNVECDDGSSAPAFAPLNFSFTVNTAIPDVTPPVVVLTSPGDGSTDNDGNVTVVYSVSDNMADPLACDVYSNTSGVWAVDDSQSTPNLGSNSFDYTGLANGTYRWNVECDDGSTAPVFAPFDFTFDVVLPAPTCGDGTTDPGEECDDSNLLNGDGCSALCVVEFCGDGTLQSLVEQCDDGNSANGDGCSDVCAIETVPPTCGDAVIDAGEECDGASLGGFTCGGLDSFTGGSLTCTPTCTFNTTACTGTPTGVCGDGAINPGESCDGADWGPVTGCSDFGYTGGVLTCSATCGFDTSACTSSGFSIINSWIYGGFYPANDDADVTETTVTDTVMQNATVQGLPVTAITDTNLTFAVLTNVSPIVNCTVIGTPGDISYLSDSPCVDTYIDPSNVTDSDTTGSSVMNSDIAFSTATYSTVTNSDVDDSNFHHCTIINSAVDELVGSYCTVTDSTVTDSTVENSTIEDGSVVTNSTITNSTVTNSTVTNSTLIDMIVTDANITDGVICSGTISDSVTYDADANGCANLTDVVNYAPTAMISASATTGTDSLTVDFSGATSTDPNIPGPLGDSLTYSWDFDDSDGITADATGVNVSHTFGVSTRVVTLTVTDSFGATDTETVTITVSSSGSSGGGSSGGGGGSGGTTGRIYILTVNPNDPVQSFYLRTGDTVKYLSGTKDISFVFRGILSDKTTMGVSTTDTYKEYTLKENTKYNFNLDSTPENDISVLPTQLYLGAGNITFELLNVEERKPILILPPAKPEAKVVVPEAGETESQVETEAESDTSKTEDEAFSEGRLEFIESLSLRKNAPLWAGIGVALLIILAGLGLYFLATRKD